jgi:hypothetical protein
MKRTHIAIGIAALALASGAQSMDDQVFVNAGDIKWGAAPPVLPKGAKLAVRERRFRRGRLA